MEEEVGNREHEGQHYRELGDSSFKLKDYKQAIENYELSLSIAREGGNRVAEGELYKSLGESYHGLDDYKQALQYYELSLGIAREGGNRVAEGQLYKNLGDSNCLLMDYKQAIMYYGLSLGIAKERGDRVEEGRMCKSLGDFYYGLGDYKQALQYYELSLYNVKEKGNRHLEGELYNSLGNVYEELKDYKQAIENYELSLSIAMEVADRTWQKELYENLGYVYTNLEDFKQAIQHYEHSLSIAKEEGDSTDEKALSKSLGDSYYSLCDYKQAIQYYEQYLRIANKVGRGVIERRVYKNLIACYESLEEHTQAIEYEEQLFSVAEEGMKGKGKETRHLQLNDLQFIGEVKEEEIVKQPHSHDMQVPPEIKGRGLRAELAYRKALQFGKVKVYHARIMLIGQDRAGKTSLKKSLLGLPFDLEEQSTVGIEVDRSSFKVEVDQVKNWQRTAKKEGVSQFARELAKLAAGELESEEAKRDLTAQNKPKKTIFCKTQESRNKSHKRREKDTLANHQSAPETPQSSIDASTPPEEFTEHLIQYLTGLNLKGDSSSTEPVVDVDVWDLAGQHLYYASHPVFFSMRALYLLVYNLSKGLNNTADPFVRQGIHDIRLENPNGETNLENLLSWLASVAAISPTQQEAGEAETPYLRPPVLMVGTHADKPFQDIKEMKIQIQKELSGKGFARHVNTQFFSIDNTQSLSDAGVIKLREEILKVLKWEPYMGEEVPVRWFNFEKVVQALNGNHTFYLNIKYLQAIVKEVCFVKDETELGVMLDFYHDLGVVVKHGSTVVLQAQWLIDLFKQLITIPRYEEVGLESRLLQKWKHLEETGILCMELVRHVFSKFIKEDSVAEKDILDMMEHFGLVAKFVTSTQNSVQYFVPAQLKSLPKDQDLCKWEASTSDPCPLYLDFLNGFVPHGIFYQLVSRCISWCSENGFKRLPTLYCHAARFFIVKNFIHPLTLLCKKRYIKIILKHREPVSEECFAEGREVAKDLRNFLKSTLQDMAQQIPWRGNLKYELCVECPFCPIARKPCQNHGKISCTHEECFCLLNMAAAERLLCEKSFCDKVPTIPGLDEWFSMEDKNVKKREETLSRGVPHEIKGLGLRAKQAYENALRIGKVKVYRARIMLIGQDRAGKTSLKKSLLGLPFDAEEQSTVGIEVDLSSFKVDVDQITNWQRTAKKEGVSQFAKELARIVAGDLKNEEAKMDLTPQSELKETRSHKTQGGELHIPNTEFATIDLSRNESHKTKEHNTLASHHSAPKTPHSKSKSSSHHMGKSKHHESQLRIDASTPPEEFTEYLIQYLKGLNLQSDCSPTEPVVDVDVWDLAGQYLYYASHPVFFSFRALYLLVCNLSKGLNKTAEPYVRQGIHDIRLENPNGETNLENLLSWLVSVDAISPTQQEAGEKEPPYVRPPVLMVGTHADKPFQDIEEMNIQIQKELSGKDFGRHVITQYFSIDNTQSSSNAGVIKLREEILKVLKEEPYMGEEVPVRWFNFEKVVQALNGNHTFYLNIKDLQAIVKEVCFVKDETELGVMLDFYHDLGVVVKHGSTVVLQAQWLIDLFKQLITIPRYEEVGLESRLINYWKYLEDTGILCMELVRHVFSKFIKEDSVAEKDILDMMERFGLVAKFVTSKQEPVQYFVPAQLKSLPKDLCEMDDPCPLYLDFLNGFVPHGIFYQLVSRCISWCKRPPTLYCYAARFFIEKKFIHPLTLLCKKRYIKIILKHREPVSEECLAEGREVKKDLRNFLESTLQDMAQQIPWRGNLKYELCVKCPFCPIERKHCQNHGKISCTHEECFCLLKMAPAERLLCGKSLCDKVPTIPGLEKWFSMEDENVKNGEETFSRGDTSTSFSLKSGTPSYNELQHLAREIHESWQALGRQLKLSEANMFCINREEVDVYEKCYRMLRKWVEAFGFVANYKTLARALEHEAIKRGDLARQYCYNEAVTPQICQDGYFSVAWENTASLKGGTPSQVDLEHLANDIFDCWKVLGRQLRLEEPKLSSIDREEPDTFEKCYKMLRKWKACNGSAADFKALAQGLEHPLVQRKDLAHRYCYIVKDTEQVAQVSPTGLNIRTTSRYVERSNPLRDLEIAALGKGFEVFPNQGQGNCLFHALSDQLDIVIGIKIEQSEVRRTLVQYLRNNPTTPDGTDLFCFVHDCHSWEDYLTKMQQDGTWGDHLILRAAANYYKTRIRVISNLPSTDNTTITPDQRGEYRHLLVLGHVHELHYVSLRPIEGHSEKRKLEDKETLDEKNRPAKLPRAERLPNEV